MRRDAESCKCLKKQKVITKRLKKCARENIKAALKPEIKKKGTGHVQAADGEHIGWGDRGCLNDAARANAADDEAQRERETAGESGDER